AIPLLNSTAQLAGYPVDVITRAGWAVILHQAAGILVYTQTRGFPGRTQFWRDALVTNQVEKLLVYGLVLSTAYVWISSFTNWIPGELVSILRAVFYGAGILCTFVSAQRWGRGEMNQTEKILLLVMLLLQMAAMAVSLILIGVLSLIGIALLGYLSGGKRVPWLVIALAFATLAVLHNGKTEMREKYWEQKYPPPTIARLPDFFGEWIVRGLQPPEDEKNVSRRLLERTSLMHILCLIVNYTPDPIDYLYGDTYGYVLPQLVPRFFWPEKPRSHVATYELAKQYGLQSDEDTESTTIAFGLLAEAYANFGLLGAILLGVFWGFVLKKLQIWSMFSPMFSFAGLLMILLTAWSFAAELTLAAWISSLFQAVIVVLGLPLLGRTFFGQQES
ncbi:MAG: O-antigen polysaccharide polymerase Wzy, partial [Opitutaceae bacterium]|nr:O-antigen polysaccharide polymerase Wzy [Opitutaceae bacterium]